MITEKIYLDNIDLNNYCQWLSETFGVILVPYTTSNGYIEYKDDIESTKLLWDGMHNGDSRVSGIGEFYLKSDNHEIIEMTVMKWC